MLYNFNMYEEQYDKLCSTEVAIRLNQNRVSIERVKNLCPMLKILVCQFRIYSPKKHTFKIHN